VILDCIFKNQFTVVIGSIDHGSHLVQALPPVVAYLIQKTKTTKQAKVYLLGVCGTVAMHQ